MSNDIIYQGNSIISVENLSDYSLPVVVKKTTKSHSSQRNILSLEKEYEMTSTLEGIKGVRQVLEKKTIENQPVLILEYIDGETLRDYIKEQSSDLKSRLEIALKLACILEKIHQKNIIHLDFNSKNIIIENETQSVNLIDLGSASLDDGTGGIIPHADG